MTDQSALDRALEQVSLLEAQNARLRRLLDNADAPGELRHRLRSTLGLLRLIIRGTAKTRQNVDDFVAHLEDRLEAVVRAQTMADTHGAVDLRDLLTEEMLSYRVSEGDRLLMEGPDLLTTPRIGQTLALGVHELTVNSIEHGVLGGDEGTVAVRWSLVDEHLKLDWTEQSPMIQPSDQVGFGREFITSGLPYQLDATATLIVEHGLVQCRMTIPLPPRG